LCKARPRHPQKQKGSGASARAADNGVSGNNEESEQSVLPDSKYKRERQARSFYQSSGKPRWRFRLQHGQEMSGDRQRQFARRGTSKAVSSPWLAMASIKPIFCGKRPGVQRLRDEITGDSIVFQETLQDRLGKTFTREVTKKITTPAV